MQLCSIFVACFVALPAVCSYSCTVALNCIEAVVSHSSFAPCPFLVACHCSLCFCARAVLGRLLHSHSEALWFPCGCFLLVCRGYDEYGAQADPYRAHDPYARAAPASAPYGTAQAPYSTAADPSAAAAAAASAQGLSVAAQQPQMMYILQDGVLKPLAVTYQQAVPAAAPGAAAAQVVPGIAGYAAAPAAAAAPTSTGGTTVLYQQAGAAGGATYAYAAPAQPAAAGAPADAAGAAPSWMGAVQQLMAGQVAASSAPLTVGAYPGAAATYTTGVSVVRFRRCCKSTEKSICCFASLLNSRRATCWVVVVCG
jgi:hypothetical protein